jgi:hypothetical protein
MTLHSYGPLGLQKPAYSSVEYPALSATSCGAVWICTRVQGFCLLCL